MFKKDIKKLQRANELIDKAYDRISEVIDSLEVQDIDSEAVLELEEVRREISNQQYYIEAVIKAY